MNTTEAAEPSVNHAHVGDDQRLNSEVVIDLTVEHAVVRYRDNEITLSIDPEPLWKRISLRSIDLTVATLGLIASAPIALVAAVVIRLTSRGPVLYTSTRLGQHGEHFQMLKFRSMVKGAEILVLPGGELADAYLNDDYKLKTDPRVTRIGKLIRRTSLDELPQLINVLRGKMSICGPRPKIIREGEDYGGALPTVLRVRPGLTGRWQVSGRSDIPFNERIMMDIDYALHRTIREDASIMLRTASHMVGKAKVRISSEVSRPTHTCNAGRSPGSQPLTAAIRRPRPAVKARSRR